MFVSRRRAGAVLAAVSTCGMILLAGGRAGALPGSFSRATQSSALPATALTLPSVGSDSGAAQAESGQPAIAENGRYVAFSSQAALKVSAAAPGARAIACKPELPSCSNVYVRDQIRHMTTLLSNSAAAP